MCAMRAASAWTFRFSDLVEKTMGKDLPRADLHISRSRDGELFLTSRQDGMIRMLVPDGGGRDRVRKTVIRPLHPMLGRQW